MGKPLRKPMPTFSSIGNENRICTRNSTQLKNSRVLLAVPSSSKNLRNGELSRKFIGSKCGLHSVRTQGTTRSSCSKNGILNGGGADLASNAETSASNMNQIAVADETPPNKRLRLRDTSHVLKHVNKSEQTDASSKNSVVKSSAISISPFHQCHYNAETERVLSTKKQLNSEDPTSSTINIDQNIFPSTSSSASNSIPSVDGTEQEYDRETSSQGCCPSFVGKVSASQKYTRNFQITGRMLPPPVHVEVAANGFQLPARRKSVRIQERRWKKVLVTPSHQYNVGLKSTYRKQDEQIEVPKFIFVGDIESTADLENPIMEDLADETFLKRHEKKEIEEKRAKKNDLREQREQAFRERMLRKQMRNLEPSPPPAPRFTFIQVIGH